MRLRLVSLPLLWSAVALAAPVKLTPVDVGDPTSFKLQTTLGGDEQWPVDGVAEIVFDAASDGAAYAAVFRALDVAFVRRERTGAEVTLARNTDRMPISEAPLRVTLSRERWRMRLLVNDEVWLTAFDDRLGPGTVACGSNSAKLPVGPPRVQTTEPAWFQDDFMREQQAAGEWEPAGGTWRTTGVSSENANQKGGPLAHLSSNPFAYRATATDTGALALTGPWFWDTYRAEASVRATGSGQVGLVVYARDKDNHLALRWASGRGGGGAEQQLVAVRGGRVEILDHAAGGWEPGQWYRLSVEIVDNHVKARIDEQIVLEADTPWFGQGRVGLWADGVQAADFDDVIVTGTDNVVDTFGARTVGRWQVARGEWRHAWDQPGPLDPGLCESADGLLLSGSTGWTDYEVTATCESPRAGGMGLIAGWQDPGNYLLLRWGAASAPREYRNQFQVVRVRDGQPEIWGAIAQGFDPKQWHRLHVLLRRGLVRVGVNGYYQEYFDAALDRGKVGLLAEGRTVTFDQLKVNFLPPPPKVEFTEQFTHEETMAEWASAAGSWEVAEAAKRGGVIWHRGEFYGDSQMAVDASIFGGPARTVRLTLGGVRPGEQVTARTASLQAEGGDSSETPVSESPGASLVLVQAAAGSKKLIGEIQAGERPLRRAEIDVDGAGNVRFEKAGQYLMGYVDDTCFVAARLDQPMPGLHAAISGKGAPIDLEKVSVGCANLLDDTFVEAPVRWHIGKGDWETTNRWKCDPRWSFFGGHNDLNPTIWSKADYAGDIQLEAFMAIKMDLPGPPYYLHPSDLAVTIGGDGVNPLSGYSLIFAARNNTRSQLFHKGRLIAENTSPEARFQYVGPQGEGLTKFHRHWFHLVLRQVRGRVQGYCDGVRLFDVPAAPDALTGKVAVYAINNGVMVSRVKVWYERQAERQPFPDLSALDEAETGKPTADPWTNNFEAGPGAFRPAEPGAPVLLQRKSAGGPGRSLAITNLRCGGTFAVTAVEQPFKVSERPQLSFRYRVPPTARINLYCKVRGRWHVAQFTGGTQPDENQRAIGGIAGVLADDSWHEAKFDLKQAFATAYPGSDPTIDEIRFAMMEPDPYLHAGFGFNGFQTTWYLDDFRLGP